MKACPNCSSVTFDDMDICYDCMNPFVEPIRHDLSNTAAADHLGSIRFQVVVAEQFAYEMILIKADGHALSVGSAANNEIVIPQERVGEHHLHIFFAHGRVWVESTDACRAASIDGQPISGTLCVNNGSQLQVGDACITLMER
ncbi:MAG: hypothetical protein LBU07_05665 [Coriobacteriales bacterium]|jgi:hypothetical protein|nr:hypothetical protein [Coriobacteriales bacterium]